MTPVRILQIDPYHKVYGLLVPELAQRLAEGLESLGDETAIVVKQFMSRLWLGDPNVVLLAAIGPTGQIKGYTAAMVQDQSQVLFIQPRLDEPTENDAVAEMVEWIERWAKSQEIPTLTLIARRIDPKWMKRFGFGVSRYILQKEIR